MKQRNTRILAVSVLLLSLGISNTASAFNVYNNTPFEICVFGNKGNFSEVVQPNTTSSGWDYGDTITLWISPRDQVVCEGDMCLTGCRDAQTHIDVPSHTQANVTKGYWVLDDKRIPMDGSDESHAFYLGGAAAVYDISLD